jgi:hypothetical protein
MEFINQNVVANHYFNHNNNNQVFYSQASWGRLEMKAHEPKKN